MIPTARQYVTIERHAVAIERCQWSVTPWWVAHYTDRSGSTHGFGGVTSQEATDKARDDIAARLDRQRSDV